MPGDKSHFHEGIKDAQKYKHGKRYIIYFVLFSVFQIDITFKQKLEPFILDL